MIDCHAAISAWFLCTFGPPSRTLVAYPLERGGMPFHDEVVVNCKNGAPTADIKEELHSIWAKG